MALRSRVPLDFRPFLHPRLRLIRCLQRCRSFDDRFLRSRGSRV